MKSFIAILGLLTISSTVFAAEPKVERCEKEILKVAEVNMDLKAYAYKLEDQISKTLIGGVIQPASLKQISNNPQGVISATMQARVIKGLYRIEIQMDQWCSLVDIKIIDESEL
jgi:hypothetical protein